MNFNSARRCFNAFTSLIPFNEGFDCISNLFHDFISLLPINEGFKVRVRAGYLEMGTV